MESKSIKTGTIISADLTVKNAGASRDFYKAVIGWEPEALSHSLIILEKF